MSEEKKLSKKKKIILALIILCLIAGGLSIEGTRQSLCKMTSGKFCLSLPPVRDLDGQEYIDIQRRKQQLQGE